ncbi:MAG: hypothetical protein VKL39_13320 [Leptolyngbyaceae bacterium]|nr:hypothetical protein [Leptolyngbyaceae bacterium]
MSIINNDQHFYSIYMSSSTVDLCRLGDTVDDKADRRIGDKDCDNSRLICSQIGYQRALNFAVELANLKERCFRDHVAKGLQGTI